MPELLQLALLIAILLPLGKIIASLCTKLGIPAIIGELMVGIAAGPGGLNLFHLSIFREGHATNSFMLLAQVGGLVLMFIAGLETDIERMKQAGVTAFLVALSGVIWPMALGAGAAHLLGLNWTASLFLGGALTATSVSISARTLMDGGHMSTPEASIILGAAVIDDVMGLFVLAFLTASISSGGESFGFASDASRFAELHSSFAAAHPLTVQMALIAVCVMIFFVVGYVAAKRWLDPLIVQMRRLSANESVTSCVFGLVLFYGIVAEWFGSVAAITGAYLLGYVFAGSKYKADIERTFNALGHGLLIPLFFVSIGLTSNFRALGGHWTLFGIIFVVAVISKMCGCGLAALARGMGWVPSLRIGCGMVSRGEVGLIVAAMAMKANVFNDAEVAMIVAVVLLTTVLTPLALRGAFNLKCAEDNQNIPRGTEELLEFLAHEPSFGDDESAGKHQSRGKDMYLPLAAAKGVPSSNSG